MISMQWLRGLVQRRRVEREIDEELTFHVEMQTRANIELGMSPVDARREALRAFGGVAQTKERVRDVRATHIDSIVRDAQYAFRRLIGQWRFTLTAAGMLALGVGIVTAMFTVVDSLLLRPVPFRDASQLVQLFMGGEHGGVTRVSPAVLDAWRKTPGIEGAESAMEDTAVVELGGTVVTRKIATVTPGIFTMLGATHPLHGRLFVADEGRPGATDRVLVSEAVWRSLYHADPTLIGRTVLADGEPLTVVGILPASFRFPSADTALWRPTQLHRRPDETAQAYVRFAANMPRQEVLRRVTLAAMAADAGNTGLHPWMLPLAGSSDDYLKRAVPLLAGGVVFVFLVLCANVCCLMMSRLTSQRREFGMRAALGASRTQLIRQALAESCVLGLAGVVAGGAVAWALVSICRSLLPEPILLQTLNPLDLDARALVSTSAAGLVATIVIGLLPAWLGTKVDVTDTLRVSDRSRTESAGARVLTRSLLIAEVCLACTLLVCGTLLTRSFVNLTHADRGIDASSVTTLWLSLGQASSDAARDTLTRSIEDDLRHLPGVRQFAWSYGLPPSGGMTSSGDWFADTPGAGPVDMTVDRYLVSPEFFSLYGIPLVGGRSFRADEPYQNVIVSQRLAQRLWPGGNPVGHHFSLGGETFEVVGIAREINLPAIDSRLDTPEFYHRYKPASTPMVSVRCAPTCPTAATLRRHLAATHPEVRVQDASPLDVKYTVQFARPRAAAAVALAFAAIAVAAALGGLFSVLSYGVSRRRREFGIRSALGASPETIGQSVLREGLLVSASGVTLGSLFAVALARTLSSLQYGVTSSDPLSWTMVLGMIALTTFVACLAPARAAARANPALLLRQE
jgi:predicted permease